MPSRFSYQTIYFDTPPQSGRAIDIWIPQHAAIQPQTLFFIHGGGWRNGHREKMHALMYAFFEKGYPCVSVDYRLGTTPAFDQVSDIREGMALADQTLREHGIRNPFVLYGSSAGAHLALLAGLAPQGACGDTFTGETPSVSGIVSSCGPVTFEPWEDIFPPIWTSMQDVAGTPYADCPELYRRLSPEHYTSAGSPPLFFLLGECEHMFPNALTIALAERLKHEGGRVDYRIYPAAEHGFFYSTERRSQQMAFDDMLQFLTSLQS